MTELFLSVGQFHKIKHMLQKFLNAKKATNDKDTLLAVQGIIEDEVKQAMTHIHSVDNILTELFHVSDATSAELFLMQLKQHVSPFPTPELTDIKKLFKKEKKLKLPALEDVDFKETLYLSWADVGTNKQYIILAKNDEFHPLSGVVDAKHIKGVCAFCKRHSTTRLFTTKKKVSGDLYVKNSQYICIDSTQCNLNLTEIDVLEEWVEKMEK
ncbi:MAG: elongation factor G-binding protein [Kurthia sp.]|nr:elongation factor G-binding protein [Candidatus Kurthia equi]